MSLSSGGVFGQPLDDEPMLALFERLEGKLADVDQAVRRGLTSSAKPPALPEVI